MSIIPTILSNGFIPLIPILLWNLLLTSHLPPAYEIKSFNSGIPPLISAGETIGRALIFTIPLLLRLEISTPTGRVGIFVYFIGLVLYFLSWIVLIAFPQSAWARSPAGFSAPAYTIIVWLAGITLMSRSFYFPLPCSKWVFAVPALVFLCFHVTHAIIVWAREYR